MSMTPGKIYIMFIYPEIINHPQITNIVIFANTCLIL